MYNVKLSDIASEWFEPVCKSVEAEKRLLGIAEFNLYSYLCQQANQFATRSVKYLISCNYFILLHSYLLNFKFHRIYILLDPYYG